MIFVLKQVVFISLIFFITGVVSAQQVQLKLSDKITATAEFLHGESTKPIIFMLHGFLLNNQFHTVKRLADSLNDSGYSVLSPNLSLGINKRKQSLSCEAIHTHSLNSDLKEIRQWLAWLEKKTKQAIILIGHSTGSIQLIYYLSRHRHNQIKHLLLLSLPNFGPTPDSPNAVANETIEQFSKAQKMLKKGDKSLTKFGLSYCREYVTTAENYISYYQLSKENISKQLDSFSIPTSLIVGSEDQRVDRHWNQKISKTNIKVINVKGANHFFDDEFEFELISKVEEILETIVK